MTQNSRTEQKLAELNQPKPWSGINAYRSDPLIVDLTAGLHRSLRDEFDSIGHYATSPEAQELARMANESPPKLRTHGPRGERLDVVEFHPAWHALMRRSMSIGLHSSVWESIPEAKGHEHKARATRFYLTSQLECGHLCPLTMTSASVAALMASPRVQREWAPKILSRKYDSSNRPALQKTAVTIGMGMTEKQGGTDVRANRSIAERVGEGIYRLSGHKWFMSAPMSDGFVMLAKTNEGIGCFLVPRLLEDGSANGLEFQRLKDKLAEAVHHCRGRSVFGKNLIDQPLMTRVLADMALDVAAATALAFRLAEAFDQAASNPADAAFARVMTPVIKYWNCKIAPSLIYEAMECMGGNGYVEERPLARHYREAPVNAIWEGSGNVMALDVLRVLSRGKDLFELVLSGFERDLGASGRKTIEVLRAAMALCETDEGAARLLVEQLALAAGAAELARLGAGKIADAFLETRLAGGWRSTYGMLDARFDASYIVDLLYPAAS